MKTSHAGRPALQPSRGSPAAAGFRMPAEWERHRATWLVWPHNREDWDVKMPAAEWCYVEIVRLLLDGEAVSILFQDRTVERRACSRLRQAGVDPDRVERYRVATNRSWIRDSGPLFLVREVRARRTQVAISDWRFNGWARYRAWQRDNLVPRRIAAGTANFVVEPAMSPEQCEAALRNGLLLGEDISADAAAFGEMGIANTSSASVIAHKLTGADLASLVGPGTGLDAPGLARKTAVLARAAARTAPRLGPGDALREYGGFEIVMMAGAMIGAARTGSVVLVDGFIASVAALAAAGLAPDLRDYLVFAHRSAEPGHRVVLDALGARPLLELDMRLGEGTGALLAWPLLRCAAATLSEMASFESAGVSGPRE